MTADNVVVIASGTLGPRGPAGPPGPLGTRVVSVISTNTNAGSISGTDYVYDCTASLYLNLPTAVGNSSRYTVKQTGTGNVTVMPNGTQKIDGAASFVLDMQYKSVDLISNGSNWVVI
jgi:hypothetical protein